MTELRHCPECGTEIEVDAVSGHCASCLLRIGLAVGGGDLLGAPPEAQSAIERVRYLGDYELIEELAHGGMGVVYKARQVSLNRTVALKLIRAGELADEIEVARFRAEAEAAANLDHPNIVPIYEVGEHKGRHYFSMKLVEGGSLSERFSNPRVRISNRDAAKLLATVARAVHYAHQRGILHRDLKPGNILLDAQGQPQVTDFGLAKRIDADSSLTLSGAIVGTPSYVAPEQAAGTKQLTTAADVYSLGAILYELLTGRAPFTGATVMETLQRVMNEEPVPPSKCEAREEKGEPNRRPAPGPSHLSPDLETICLKCLEKDPAHRFGSAEALAEDLERWLRHEPIRARPSTPVERLGKWTRRNSLLAGAIAAIFFVAVIGLAGVVWQWRQAVAAHRTAEKAKEEKQEQLWASQLQEARDYLVSGKPGHRTKALAVILRAAAWRPSVDLRNAAVASLLLPDVGATLWEREHGHPGYQFPFDAEFAHYMPYSHDGEVVIHRSADHAVVARFEKLARDTTWAEFSPDGRHLAVFFGGEGSQARFGLWEWRAGKLLVNVPTRLNADNRPTFAFTPDGREVALASLAQPVRRFDVATGQELQPPLLSSPALGLRFNEAGAAAVLTSGYDLQVWNLAESNLLARLPVGERVNDFAWHPNNAMLAIGTARSVLLWKVGAKEPIRSTSEDFVTRVFFNPDGDLLIAGGWGWFRILDAENGRVLVSEKGRHPIQLSRDGTKLTLVNPTGSFSVDEFLPPAGWRRFLVPLANGHGNSVDFHSSGRWLLSAHNAGWLLWDSVQGRSVTNHSSGIVSTVQFLPSGDGFLTSCDSAGVQQWPFDAGAGESPPRIGEPRTLIPAEPWHLERFALAPDGKRFAALNSTSAAMIWDMAGARPIFLQEYAQRPCNYIHFSPDGRWVMTGNHNGTQLHIYDASDGRHVVDLPSGNGYGLFQTRGELVVGNGPRDYGLWRLGTLELARRVPWGEAGYGASAVGVSPDDRYVLVADRESHLRFRDFEHDRDFVTLTYPSTGLWGGRYDANGTRIAGTSSLSQIMLWDLAALRKELARLGLDWPEEHPGEGFAPRRP